MSNLNTTELVMPNVGANDNEIKIVKIFYEQGALISNGQVLFELESSKTIFDFISEKNGYFYSLFEESEMVKINSVIGIISDDKLDQPEIVLNKYKIKDVILQDEGKVITSEASKLIEFNKIDIQKLKGDIITKEDVLDFLNKENPIDINSLLAKINLCEESIMVYGAGFQGKMILDALSNTKYNVACFVESNPDKSEYYDIPVIPMKYLDRIRQIGITHAHIAIGNPKIKIDICKVLEEQNFEIISIFHDFSSISKSAKIGKGVYLGPFVSIGPDTIIGDFCQINNASSIAHDSKLGLGVMIADGCRIGGSVVIGDFANLGINVSVNRDLIIGKRVSIISGVSIYSHIGDDKVVKLQSNNLIIK